MISRDPFQLQLFCVSFSVEVFSYVALLLRANADPYRPGFPFEHLVLKFCCHAMSVIYFCGDFAIIIYKLNKI